jgi:LysR family glycine cleavage system transcriptional activator
VLGLGVALARVSLVAHHLVSGALACPLPFAAPTAYSYYLLGLPEVVDRPKIAAFRMLLINEAADTEAFGLTLGVPRPIAA